MEPVLLNGEWTDSSATESFQASNPANGEALPAEFPVSPRAEIEQAIAAADAAFQVVRSWPGERFAAFLGAFADAIEARTDALVETANLETALPVSPRLRDGELPRTTNQLRQAAAAAREGTWAHATIDSAANVRSVLGPVGPVSVFGPNNFPFAFNSIAGGDFAAAVAAGNPVVAKGHSSHPGTTKLFAEAAHEAAQATDMPPGFVQLLYRTSHADGELLVAHPKIGASGYTGSRSAGLVLKKAADAAGKPIYLELSSINPVFILPGTLEERAAAVVDEFVGSCLMGTGQFCTNPGLVVLPAGPSGDEFVAAVKAKFEEAPAGTLLGEGVRRSFLAGVKTIREAGAELVTGGDSADATRVACQNTILKTTAAKFVADPETLQTEAFGNGTLFVLAENVDEMVAVAEALEGNLTGCLYSDTGGLDDDAYDRVAPAVRQQVGRLLNDKMPTGVAVTAAMNHGGPFPATGHPGFTAVGVPASLVRFGMLQCYDNVRPHRLPPLLQDANPGGLAWRLVDGNWTKDDVPA